MSTAPRKTPNNPPAVSGRAMTPDAEAYAAAISQQTGLDLNVVRAWVKLESRGGQGNKPGQYAAGGPRAYNFLNLSITRPGQDRKFATVDEAAAYAANNLKKNAKWYGAVLASAGQAPQTQIAALADSPWAAGHYGGTGGPDLLAVYNQLGGTRLGPVTQRTSPTPSFAPAGAGSSPLAGMLPSTDSNPYQTSEAEIRGIWRMFRGREPTSDEITKYLGRAPGEATQGAAADPRAQAFRTSSLLQSAFAPPPEQQQ